MAQRLESLGLLYEYLKVQYESTSSQDAFVKWLQSIGVKHKAWHEKFAHISRTTKYIIIYK